MRPCETSKFAQTVGVRVSRAPPPKESHVLNGRVPTAMVERNE
jgi:hypothetical protein